MKKPTYTISEFGVIRSRSDYPATHPNSMRELYLPQSQFESLYEFVVLNQDKSSEGEKALALASRGRKKEVRVRNYVGVIETKSGIQLEILPKINLKDKKDEIRQTKRIFLKMLSHLKNSPFVSISKAQIDAPKDFPILEVFISAYVSELENNIKFGIKRDYLNREDNLRFLRGKLKVTENLRYNVMNRSRFYCEYSEFSSNTALNRIIKTTLIKLERVSNNHGNILAISKLLTHFEEVDLSFNVRKDLGNINLLDKSLVRYQRLRDWSEIFLTDKSFTNFRGENANLAILFPMEKVFEDYIGYLLKKHAGGSRIRTQDRTYFLIEKHRESPMFGLRPDFVVESYGITRKLVDTKWKLIDESAPKKNYNISQADIYQLYAYGKKYSRPVEPKLVLLYPSNPLFKKQLDPFFYEGDLRLDIIPFDFTADEKTQIEAIISL